MDTVMSVMDTAMGMSGTTATVKLLIVFNKN